MDKLTISLAPDSLFTIAGFTINSAHLALFLITLFLLSTCLWIASSAKLRPTRLQVVLEEIIIWFYEKVEMIFPNKKVVRRVFPLIITMFIIIIISNLFSLIPVLESLRFGDKEMFRSPTSDVSMPLALGLFAVILGHIVALLKAPLRHIGKYINIAPFFKARSIGDVLQAMLDFFLSLMDIIGEFSKIVSISFRLFGNIFAGVAISAVFSFLAPYLIPIPFLALGIFSGVIQALVFALLALQFLSGPMADLFNKDK